MPEIAQTEYHSKFNAQTVITKQNYKVVAIWDRLGMKAQRLPRSQ